MSPSQPTQAHLKQNDTSDMTEIELSQPKAREQMNPLQAPPQTQSDTLRLRGGDRGGMCPGRFCFIIPCPIPCDCCII